MKDNPMSMKTFEHEKAHSNRSSKIPKGKLIILLFWNKRYTERLKEIKAASRKITKIKLHV